MFKFYERKYPQTFGFSNFRFTDQMLRVKYLSALILKHLSDDYFCNSQSVGMCLLSKCVSLSEFYKTLGLYKKPIGRLYITQLKNFTLKVA